MMKVEFLIYSKKIILTFVFSCIMNIASGSISQNILHDRDLEDLSYKELQEKEIQALEVENWSLLGKFVDFHLNKAKREGIELEIARAYYYKSVLEDPAIALMYADSIVSTTQKSLHPNFPTMGYALKGHIYYESGDFENALNNYIKAYNLALKKDNNLHQREISQAIAAIRNINGQHYAAADLYRTSLNTLFKEKNYKSNHREEYMTLLYNLSLTHLRLQELDSARFYIKEGIFEASLEKRNRHFKDLVLLEAQINYYDGNYSVAKDTLIKYLDSLDGTSRAIKHYYLGKIAGKMNNEDLAIEHFKKIDSIITRTGDPFFEIKDVYHQLMISAIRENDKRKQVEYISKLVAYDSILSSGQENIINKAMISYDIPYLKYQKKKAEEQLEARSRYTIFAGLLGGLSFASGLHFYIRSRRMRRRLKQLLKEGVVESNFIPEREADPLPSVPEDIRNDILRKLEIFENSEKFLNKDLDMSTLANDLKTNTTYLSVVINHYKKMTFPNYLKSLKIGFAIRRLNEDSELLKYNYQGLADEFGFKTGESFSKAFYHSTGVYPSKFLNELKTRKNGGHL